MTVEDPEVLLEPWVMSTRVLPVAQGAGFGGGSLTERAMCEVYEEDNVTSQVRH
jgi:hypothetical protein